MVKTDALIILDGFGLSDKTEGNAIYAQGIPYIKSLMAKYPMTQLEASGLAVGLPEGLMGNSEVGHLNLGAGRVIYQDITLIDKSIDDGDFFQNAAFMKAIDNCKEHNSSLHIAGLCSDGGVHSSLKHLFALFRLAKQRGVKVYMHFIADGRDVSPQSSRKYLKVIEDELKRLDLGKIATVSGRYYIMDRDKHWDRVEPAYEAVVRARGERVNSAEQAIIESYIKQQREIEKNHENKIVSDEFIYPVVIEGYEGMKADDGFIFLNFRADRAREITRTLTDPEFDAFKTTLRPAVYVGMTEYDSSFKGLYTAFPPKVIKNTLAEWLSSHGVTQAHVAETEKYAHVTFFFNGGIEAPYKDEMRTLIPSPSVKTYDMKPEMSAKEVADAAIKAMDDGARVLILNFANCDMVGHTGSFPAAVKAVATVDAQLKRVVDRVLASGGTALVTADHGNAETMINEKGEPMTAHTVNPVPFILAGEKYIGEKLRDGGALCDVSPTLLEVIGLPIPPEMKGKSLIASK